MKKIYIYLKKNVITARKLGWFNKHKKMSLHFDESICDLNTYDHDPFYSALHQGKKNPLSWKWQGLHCLCNCRSCSVCITFQRDESALLKRSLGPVDFATTSFREVSVTRVLSSARLRDDDSRIVHLARQVKIKVGELFSTGWQETGSGRADLHLCSGNSMADSRDFQCLLRFLLSNK